MYSGFIFISSFANNFEMFIILYGIVPPLILGVIYILPLHCAWAYFPEHKAKVTGIISTAFGFSTTIFNYISTQLVNYNNLKPTIFVWEGK